MQPEVTELTEEEKETYLRLQKKVGWKRTGTEIFESFFPILPMVCCELALVRKINGVDSVLMWRRKDAYYDGWHMPGGYILHGESDEEWIRRVLKKETNLELRYYRFITHFNTRPETGWVPNHQVAIMFYCVADGELSVGRFFPLTRIPEDTLGHHRRYVEHLRAYLLRPEAEDLEIL